MCHPKYLSSRIAPYPKAEKIDCQRRPLLRVFVTSNASLKMLKPHYNRPRPATPSFIMMIATNTGSRPSNQLAILQQALKERVKKCVLLQNPWSSTSQKINYFQRFLYHVMKGPTTFCTTKFKMHSLFRFIVKSNSPQCTLSFLLHNGT